MKTNKFLTLLLAISVLFGMISLVRLVGARGEPPPGNYAEFANLPYLMGGNTISVSYVHGLTGSMTIRLYWYETQMWYWSVAKGNGTVTYNATIDGIWRLECYLPGYISIWTDETHDIFNITDPSPSQNNLGSDWARHPTDPVIYWEASQIVNQTTSAYEAAQRIYSHVLARFPHNYSFGYSFRSDQQLLNDLNTYGFYGGVCRSDAVILTAYARAMGIPARIVHLEPYYCYGPGWYEYDEHYFAEFYVLNSSSQWQWVPVDGDQWYDWFGLDMANQKISFNWPAMHKPGAVHWWLGTIYIVTQIPQANIEDSGYTQVTYPDPPLSPNNAYRNDL